jgi:hypothetical protein
MSGGGRASVIEDAVLSEAVEANWLAYDRTLDLDQ